MEHESFQKIELEARNTFRCRHALLIVVMVFDRCANKNRGEVFLVLNVALPRVVDFYESSKDDKPDISIAKGFTSRSQVVGPPGTFEEDKCFFFASLFVVELLVGGRLAFFR